MASIQDTAIMAGFSVKPIMIYDRMHNALDEIDDYMDDLQYGWTLDDIDTLTVSLPLYSPKCTAANTQFGNHIELVDKDSGAVVWGGVITGRNFNDQTLQLTCSDYNVLLKFRRLRAKQYPAMEYGALMRQMIDDCQAARPDYPIGLTGYNIAAGALQTTRLVANTDFLWAKIKEFDDDANYDYGVGTDRSFNFWLRKGTDKLDYMLEWGGDRDNIISKPTLGQDILNLADSIYAESEVISDSGTNTTLTSNAEDIESEQLYGLYEGVFSPNDGVSVQSTLDTQVNGELQRARTPANSITLSVKDSNLCPFGDIEVGDRTMVHLIPYFDFLAPIRILAMQHNEKQGTREITVGSVTIKPAAKVQRLYKG